MWKIFHGSFGLNPAPHNSLSHSKMFFVTTAANLTNETMNESSSPCQQLSVILRLIYWGHWLATQD